MGAAPATTAPGATGRHAPGVNVVGYLSQKSGLGEVARLVVAAAQAANVPYALVSEDGRVRSRTNGPRGRGAANLYDTNVVCINSDRLPEFVGAVGHSFLRDRHTIGFWWWEVDAFPR